MYNFYNKKYEWEGCVPDSSYRGWIHTPGNKTILQIIMQIKIIAFLLVVSFTQVDASVNAQNVTLKGKDISLEKVFEQISNQTGFDFLFTTTLLKKAKKIDIDVKNRGLEEVLEEIFEDQPLSFSIENKSVVIAPKLEKTVVVLVQPELRGRVVDSIGTPVRNASIRIKETNQTTITDNNGEFLLTSVPRGAMLVITCVGFRAREVRAQEGFNNIVLSVLPSAIEEIQVNVGYGEMKARDLTGSVARVTAEDLEGAPPHTDIAGMLQGKAAGVNVMITSGAPGSPVAVQIRGTTSLTGNNQPLWVIDGIPQYNVNGDDIASILYDFNVTDVESVDILKDASATAIYGSRAANGVIIVTTKRGRRDQTPQFDFSYNNGMQIQQDGFRMLNTQEFIDVITDATRNYFSTTGAGVATGAISTVLDRSKIIPNREVDYMSTPILSTAFFNGTTDWWEELTRTAMESKYDLSLRGGSANNSFYIAAGITDHNGVIKGSDRTGFSGRINFDTSLGEDFRLGIQANGSYSGLNNKDVMIDKIWNFRPDFPMYDESGAIFDPGYNEENPLTSLKNQNLSKRKGFQPNAFLEYKPIGDLTLRSSISLSYNETISDRFVRAGTSYTTHKGQANVSQSESNNWVFENTATYNKSYAKHSFVGLAGFIMERGVTSGFGIGIQNFPDQDIMTNIGSGTTPMKPTSQYTSSALVSGLTRLNYKYANKYLATFTFRTDGSSRFGPDKRWAYFPSGALAWVISEESFIKDKFQSKPYLKIRSSYGISGSQNLGNFDWYTLYTAAQYNEQPGFAPSQIGNNDLRWEQTTAFDVGLDYGFLNDRLQGTIGVYQRQTDDIIYNKLIPSSSAFLNVKQNVASIRNTGYEFDINYDVIRNSTTRVTLNFNIAHNVSKALSIDGFNDELLIYSGSAQAMRIKEGEELHQWYGFKWSGRYYQSMEEYNLLSTQNPTTGAKIWYQSGLSSIRPGDLRYEDTNGDGIVNNDDRVALGSAQPKFFGGFGPSLSWKNLSVQTNFSFSTGATRYWYTNSANWYSTGLFHKNYPAYVKDSWSPDNRESAWPRMAFGQGSSNTFSDFWLSKADYLRLNLVRISYRIPKSWINIKHIGGLDFAASATNLFTWTTYNGIDPQGNFRLSTGGIAGTGSDFGTYPSAKSFNFSAKLSLR